MPKKSKKTKSLNKLPKSAVNVEKQIRGTNQIATLPPWRTTPMYYSTFGANNWA